MGHLRSPLPHGSRVARRRAFDDETHGSRMEKPTTRKETVGAFRMMVARADTKPAQYEFHSGRIGGATQLAAQGMSEMQIQIAGRWKSRALMEYVREAGEGVRRHSKGVGKTLGIRCLSLQSVRGVVSVGEGSVDI
ncbi:unnamed protein product [Ectocarpus fasciculatus]